MDNMQPGNPENPNIIVPPVSPDPVSPPPAEPPQATPPQPAPLGPLLDIPKRRRWPLVLGILATILLLVLIALYVIVLEGKTVLGSKLQDRVWAHVIESAGTQPSDSKLMVRYEDSGTFTFIPSKVVGEVGFPVTPEEAAQMDEQYSFTLSGLAWSVLMEGYASMVNPKEPELDGRLAGSYTNRGTTYEGSLDIKMDKLASFFRYDYNQAVAQSKWVQEILQYDDQITQQKNKWIKTESSVEDVGEFINLDSYEDILKRNRIVKIKSFQGFSSVHGHLTAHYEVEFDTAKAKTLMSELNREIQGADSQDLTYMDQVVDALLDKMQISSYEVWVGVFDRQVYKTVYESNALSITKTADSMFKKYTSGENSLVETALGEAQKKSRDAKRMADIRQLATGAELYFNDEGKYPTNLAQLVPLYFGEIPTAPTPVDGSCTEAQNTYTYTQTGGGTGYSLTFCLGATTAGYEAGVRTLTQTGIDGQFVGDSEMPPTNDLEAQAKKIVLDTIRELNFDAKLYVTSEAKNYGEDRVIEAPKDYQE